jgi:hypothetical protein
LSTIKKHWGAGFEVVYAANCEFFKLEEITFIIHQGQFDKDGQIHPPIPSIILHYKYHGDVLVITVLAPNNGKTKVHNDQIITEYTHFRHRQFIVEPILGSEGLDLEKVTANPSFVSRLNAMGYILETIDGSKYSPSSFHFGPEVTVEYQHNESVTITMKKELNDILLDAVKKALPILSS